MNTNKSIMIILLLLILAGVIATQRLTKYNIIKEEPFRPNDMYVRQYNNAPATYRGVVDSDDVKNKPTIKLGNFEPTSCPELVNGLGFDCYKCSN